MNKFKESIYKLIVETATQLPNDVRHAIAKAKQKEDARTTAGLALGTITDNIRLADETELPICQDTGMLTFELKVPVHMNQIKMKRDIYDAIIEATRVGKLRPNSVDSLTGENSGTNIGEGTPVIHFEQWENEDIDARLILKGGGCENKNIQYSLPTELEGLGQAGRDIDGIRKCILHSVYQAQGQGCSAGFIGVGVGGDRTTSYNLAKQQLFRSNDDINENEQLKQLEEYCLDYANRLGVGTMGFGGVVTLLGCKIGTINRLPASFFVSVTYNCWAFRRLGVMIAANTGEIKRWLYKDGEALSFASSEQLEVNLEKEIILQAPITEEQIRQLRVGDVVTINGPIHTGRDAIHHYLIDNEAPVDLNGEIIYHCGPVMLKDASGKWYVKAAGPTTSIREEPYQGEVMKKFGIRAVVGKGGMGKKTLQALQEHGGVYLNAIGGAAQYYANCIKDVKGVDLLQFGVPEAMWHLDVKDFKAIVTMDSHGNSLHADVEKSSFEKLSTMKQRVF